MEKTFSKILICLLIFTLRVSAQKYDIRDLEQLSKNKNFQEFLNHAKDIRPSKRTKYWSEMLQNMALGQIDFYLEKRILNDSSFTQIEKLALWPELIKDEFFQIKRNRFVEFYLEQCFEKRQNKQTCSDQLYSFWNSSNQNPDLAMTMVNILRTFSSAKNYWTFYQKITKSDLQEFYCPKPRVKTAIFNHLRKNLEEVDEVKVINNFITTSIGNTCWHSILADLKGLLFSKKQGLRDFSFKILSAKEAMTQLERDTYLVFYILSNPIIGNNFNRAWTTMMSMGQDYGRRVKVYNRLKFIDPLPGEVFSHRVTEKREAIINLFHQNFPEYLNHYAKTCVNFLKGQGDFPNGNPTLHCDELYKISKKKRWINQTLKLQYSAIKK
ncbi:hypothetical protein A9Q84_06880 [Halobacteriovorax marinus]|uniref:Uncharacterized protein n=1 Tax=Halobacteriovorax marinus TaxID=97084 RepID=A0A1Y5FFI3_9BACT|nr:hypothetical protein A9Q84_06880 [Halobacteriovorax marinus]